MSESIHKIRQAIKAKRLSLSHADQQQKSVVISDKLNRLIPVRRSKRIALYMPVKGEVDCLFLAECANLRKKQIFLPVLRGRSIAFAPLKNENNLRRNRFGILEPVYKNAEICRPSQLDVVITPLVAFDPDCNRIGMGGGFYDRCFAFRKRRKNWRRPFLVGVAYDFQRVNELTPEPWDVPLDAVITEEESYKSY